MKRVRIILGAVVVLLAVIFFGTYLIDRSFRPNAGELSELEATFGEPRIVEKADQKMLVIVTIGDPSEFAGKAIMKLFGVLRKLKADHANIEMSPPRGRWPKPYDTPREEFEGHWAVAVPDSVTELPPIETADGLAVELKTWEYGQVAEILHIGSYDTETLTVARLKAFIAEQGYEIAGVHEEEYWSGPSMFPYLDNPDGYYTVLRYRVRKK